MLFLAAEAAEAANGGFWSYPSHENMELIIWTWIGVAIVIVFAYMARPAFQAAIANPSQAPGGVAGWFEHTYHWINDLSTGMMGELGTDYVPFGMTIFLFVLVCNWMGLVPLVEPPTSSVYTTLSLAIVSFLGFNAFGLWKAISRVRIGHTHHHVVAEGMVAHEEPPHTHPPTDMGTAVVQGFTNWLGHYFQPVPSLWRSMEGAMRIALVPLLAILFIGLNILEEYARLISLTFRLFGNIYGEHQVKSNLSAAMLTFGHNAMKAFGGDGGAGMGVFDIALAAVMWGIMLFVTVLGALGGFIQAFIFMVLSLSYIAHVVAEEH
jgi:F0F1-type ATP synthase membrane subunit a